MKSEDLRMYLRVDGTEDDTTIGTLQKAAEEYLTNAGVPIDYTKELYALAIKLLVSHWYDNRMIQSDKTANKLPFSLDAIIIQLKYGGDDNV